jgi:hypothetical protein
MALSRQEATRNELSDVELDILRRRGRVLVLLDAAERAGITPLETTKFHAFAYLADVLSPVWHLPAFNGVILKTTGGPFYRDFQREIDHLVVAGLLEVHGLKYVDRPRDGARIFASYSLRFESPQLETLLTALGARSADAAIDPRDCLFHTFLVELANALARLPDNEIDKAASADVTYADPRVATNNLLEFDGRREGERANLSVATADRFNTFVPEGLKLSAGEKLYLYASYLGKRIHARR